MDWDALFNMFGGAGAGDMGSELGDLMLPQGAAPTSFMSQAGEALSPFNPFGPPPPMHSTTAKALEALGIKPQGTTTALKGPFGGPAGGTPIGPDIPEPFKLPGGQGGDVPLGAVPGSPPQPAGTPYNPVAEPPPPTAPGQDSAPAIQPSVPLPRPRPADAGPGAAAAQQKTQDFGERLAKALAAIKPPQQSAPPQPRFGPQPRAQLGQGGDISKLLQLALVRPGLMSLFGGRR